MERRSIFQHGWSLLDSACVPVSPVGDVVSVALPVSTPGIEKLGGAGGVAGVPVDVSPGTDVEPLSSGGVTDPTSCANAISGEEENETMSTTANNFLMKSSRIVAHAKPRPI
jgi:hypothetical protein